jgi:hypothetical protein
VTLNITAEEAGRLGAPPRGTGSLGRLFRRRR